MDFFGYFFNKYMKSLLTYLTLFVILISLQGVECSKNADAPAADAGLNSVEQIIKGVWFLKSKSDTLLILDTASGKMKFKTSKVYKTFAETPYIELKTTKLTRESLFAQTKAKDATNAGANMGDTSLYAMRQETKLGYWLYDQSLGMLVWNSFHYRLLTATEKELEVRFESPIKESAWTINWKFSR